MSDKKGLLESDEFTDSVADFFASLITTTITAVLISIFIIGINSYKDYSENKHYKNASDNTDINVLSDAPDRCEYANDNMEHWGDCLSVNKKEGWKPLHADFDFKDLEPGREYNLTFTLGRRFGPNDGENIDAIKCKFTPAISEGNSEYIFYINPKWVNNDMYTFFIRLDK